MSQLNEARRGDSARAAVEAIEKGNRCKFSTYGYACGKHVEHGRYLCEEHATAKCASCGQPATHGCDFCGQFVCGTPLCDECTFGTDDSKSAGAWGFMNHIHVSRPEFADKHENRRLKEENAALARKAEALQREVAELRAVMKECHAALNMMISPGDISGSTVLGAFAAAESAEARARALLGGENAGN